jgi:hypothetical protein
MRLRGYWNAVTFASHSNHLPRVVAELAAHLRRQDRELVILVDEIQGPFVLGTGQEFQSADEQLLINCLKQLLPSCRTVFTGSGMVTAMLHMSLAKTNGHTFLGATSAVDMGELLPNPKALPAMVTAVADAAGLLPGPGRPSVEAVLEAMASHPAFVGSSPRKLPIRLAAAAEVLFGWKKSAAATSLAETVMITARSKLVMEARSDLARAVMYAVDRESDALELLASLAYGACTWSDFTKAAGSPFYTVIRQLVVPAGSDQEPALLLPPYDLVVKDVLSSEGKPVKFSEEQFQALIPQQLAFFFEAKKLKDFEAVFDLKTQEKVSRAVLRILVDYNAAYFQPRETTMVSRMPRDCFEFAEIPLVVKLMELAEAAQKQATKDVAEPWVKKLKDHAKDPTSGPAKTYFKTAGYELMCVIRHWIVHKKNSRFSASQAYQLGLTPKMVFDLVQYGLCNAALEGNESVYSGCMYRDKKDGFVYMQPEVAAK